MGGYGLYVIDRDGSRLAVHWHRKHGNIIDVIMKIPRLRDLVATFT